MLKGILFSWNG